MKEQIKKIPILGKIAVSIWKYLNRKKRRERNKKEEKEFSTLLLKANPIRLVIGASNTFQKGWVPSNIEYLNILNLGDWERYFNKESIHCMLAEHVWEHLTLEEGNTAAKNCYKYLMNGSYIRIAVPDGFHPDKEYIEEQKVGGRYKAGGRYSEIDAHKVLYNYKTLSSVFQKAGFQIKLLEYFDENQEFHSNEWLVEDGLINRSLRFDRRNLHAKPIYTSVIIDAIKE